MCWQHTHSQAHTHTHTHIWKYHHICLHVVENSAARAHTNICGTGDGRKHKKICGKQNTDLHTHKHRNVHVPIMYSWVHEILHAVYITLHPVLSWIVFFFLYLAVFYNILSGLFVCRPACLNCKHAARLADSTPKGASTLTQTHVHAHTLTHTV